MKIGDLVRYADSYSMRPKPLGPELGIITKTNPDMPLRCHVEWFSCDNRGWWSYKNLEVISENR
jgi:hypothetical protein